MLSLEPRTRDSGGLAGPRLVKPIGSLSWTFGGGKLDDGEWPLRPGDWAEAILGPVPEIQAEAASVP